MEFNIFDSCKSYGGYNEIERRKFNEKELSVFKKCSIVPSQYGYSVCFMLHNGLHKYIPLCRDAIIRVNDGDLSLGEFDKDRMELVMLQKGDENPIPKIDVK